MIARKRILERAVLGRQTIELSGRIIKFRSVSMEEKQGLRSSGVLV